MYDITILLSSQHNAYTWHFRSHIWHHSHCICLITQMAHTSVLMHCSINDITTSVYVSHLAHMWDHTKCTSHHIHTLWHQWSCFITSQTLHSWHQISSLWHHIHSLGHHTTLCMISSPLYLASRPLYLCHHTNTIDDITATIWVVSHPVYLWHHNPYIYDIISTKYDGRTLCVDDPTLGICATSFALQVTSHPFYHTKALYLWCHIHFRHDIALLVSDISPTVSLSFQPLRCYHTQFRINSHPPSVWHHMHYI